MDFFRSQDIARRNTRKLVVLFALAVGSLIVITNLLIMLTLGLLSSETGGGFFERIDWQLFAGVSVGVVVVIVFGSLYKIASLSGGGARVAEMLQGQLISDASGDLNKQKILNVVEEMAIAAGTPVPPVYLLAEDGINAFAAGYSSADAVIGVTRGAIEKLSREELQGVVAHEFSHILHGDMRLNIRLIGLLHGIMVLGLMGYYMLRTFRSSRRGKNAGNIVFLALGLMVIGYAGTFFGNLIKSGVSRQREFLADASAVQYTRNPAGIAGALKRIGADSQGSLLDNAGAAEISHALFSNGVASSFANLFATHPPLEKRIRKIQPNWDGDFSVAPTPKPEPASASKAKPVDAASRLSAVLLAGAMLEQTGNPDATDLQNAQRLLANVPPELHTAAHELSSACALIYLLLLDNDPVQSARQLQYLQENADQSVLLELRNLHESHHLVSRQNRLLLVNISLPALRQLSRKQYSQFRNDIEALVQQDGKYSLWEWVLQRVVLHQLDAVFQPKAGWQSRGNVSSDKLQSECAEILAFLARAGRPTTLSPESVFASAAKQLGLPDLRMPDRDTGLLKSVNSALDALADMRALEKPAFLKACAQAIGADGVATVEEIEIFRAIAEALDCPMPPLPENISKALLLN